MEVKGDRALGRRLAERRHRRAARGRAHPRADRLSLTRVDARRRRAARDRLRRDEHRRRPARPGRPAGRRAARRPADRADREDGRRQQRDALLGRRAAASPATPTGSSSCRRHAARACRSPTCTATSSSTSTSSRTAATPCRLVGLAREVAAVTGAPVRFPATDARRDRAGRRRPPARSTSRTPALCPRFVGRWVSGVTGRAVAGPRPDAPPGGRHAAGQQRRRRHQLRDARARQADPHVRRARPSTTAGSSSAARRRRRAARDARPRRARARPGDAPHRRPGRAARDRRRHGRRRPRRSPTRRPTSIVESAIFDPVSIRRTAFRYALRSEASLRFEKGQESRLARLGADRTARLVAAWAGGAVAPGAVDTDAGRARAGARRLPAGPGQPAARRRTLADRRAARRSSAASGSRPSRPPPAPRSRSPAGAAAARRSTPVTARPSSRSSRLAPRPARSRRTWPRRSPASAGYEVVPEIRRTRRCRHYRPEPLEVRDAVREALAGAGLTEVVTHALVAPDDPVERFGRVDDGDAGRRAGAARAAADRDRHEPALEQHSVLRQSLAREPPRGRRARTCATAATTSRSSRSARATAGRRRRATREWWRLGFVLAGAAVTPSWNQPVAAVRPRRREGPGRAGLPAPRRRRRRRTAPLPDDPNLHPGRAARVGSSRPRAAWSPGVSGSSIRRWLAASGPAGGAVVVGELAIAGLAGGPRAGPRRDAAAPPGRRARPRGRRRRGPACGRRSPPRCGARRRRCSRRCELFDVYRGAPLDGDREEPGLAARVPGAGPDAHRGRDRRRDRGDPRPGSAADVGGRIRG